MFSVIFEVNPADEREAYLAHALGLKPLLEAIDGFIDNERFESRSRPGWLLSHSTWRDEKAVVRWRTQFRHHQVQGLGREAVFADYHLRVGEVTEDSDPPAGIAVHEQRFDATAVGRSPACTLLELGPAALPAGLAEAVGLAPAPPGLHEVSIYDSITNAGKVLVLAAWAGPEPAGQWRPGAVAGARLRRRAVRIIRDYGMADRREAPQCFAPVAPQPRANGGPRGVGADSGWAVGSGDEAAFQA